MKVIFDRSILDLDDKPIPRRGSMQDVFTAMVLAGIPAKAAENLANGAASAVDPTHVPEPLTYRLLISECLAAADRDADAGEALDRTMLAMQVRGATCGSAVEVSEKDKERILKCVLRVTQATGQPVLLYARVKMYLLRAERISQSVEAEPLPEVRV